MRDQTIMYHLFLDGEEVGEGAVLLDSQNRICGAGGPIGLVNFTPMEPFQRMFNGYIRTEDTGITEPWGKEGEVAKVVNVYTLSPQAYNLHQRSIMGGCQQEVLPF